jgi:Acetyltransferase (GNAT) domain
MPAAMKLSAESDASLPGNAAGSIPSVEHADWTVEVVDSQEKLRALIPAWRTFLQSGATGGNLYNDPDYIDLRLQLESGIQPWIVVVRQRGQIECIAPFYFCTSRFRLQCSVLTLLTIPVDLARVFGDDFLLMSGERAEQCLALAMRPFDQSPQPLAYVYLDRLETGSTLWRFFESAANRTRFRLFLASPQIEKAHQILFPDTHEAYMASLGSRTRQNLRRMARKLCNDQQARIEMFTTVEQVPEFLELLDQVFRQTWQARTFGYWPRNTKAQIDLMAGLARLGWLRSYILHGPTGPIAFELAYQYQGVFYAQEIGFSQDWSQHSPGSVLMHLYIEDLLRHDAPRLLDFGVGDATYKQSFCNAHRDSAAVFLAPPNRWRWMITFQRWVYALERATRRIVTALHLDRILRKLLKRQR